MKPYASLAAFLAHYRALRSEKSLSIDDRRHLVEMEAAMAARNKAERAILETAALGAESGSAARHRVRAERRLARELAAKGMLAG